MICEVKKCDKCGVILQEPNYFYNDGTGDNLTYAEIEDQHFCFGCLGKMLYTKKKQNVIELLNEIEDKNLVLPI